MKRYAAFFSAVLIFLPSLVFSAAKPVTSDQYFPDFSGDLEMNTVKDAPSFSSRGIQYGAWVTPAFIARSVSGNTASIMTENIRLWGKMYLWSNSFIYVRGKYVRTDPVDWEGLKSDNMLDLDLGYIDMSFFGKSLNVAVGRKYFFLGTGLVLNGRGDGADIRLNAGPVSLRAFGLYIGFLNKDDNPFRLSTPDYADGAKRIFAGGSAAADFLNQKLYGFGLVQIDKGDYDERKEKYSSLYTGAGLKGFLFGASSYYAEFIYESGESCLSGSGEKKDISAMAVNSGLNISVPVTTSPLLLFQYSWGSGDGDRKDSVSPNGNVSGKDETFISFGTFTAGYALNPSIGNLHVFRAGFRIAPFEALKSVHISRLMITAKYSYYMKDKAEGTISGGEAAENSRYAGQGADASLTWKIFSDMSVFASYGIFLPGDAYSSDEKNRHFFMSGLNIHF